MENVGEKSLLRELVSSEDTHYQPNSLFNVFTNSEAFDNAPQFPLQGTLATNTEASNRKLY